MPTLVGAPSRPQPILVCRCGLTYSAEEWAKLPFVATMPDGIGGVLELRNCRCGSTRAIELPKPAPRTELRPLARCAPPAPPSPPAPAQLRLVVGGAR